MVTDSPFVRRAEVSLGQFERWNGDVAVWPNGALDGDLISLHEHGRVAGFIPMLGMAGRAAYI
jgi:hypothetical protein